MVMALVNDNNPVVWWKMHCSFKLVSQHVTAEECLKPAIKPALLGWENSKLAQAGLSFFLQQSKSTRFPRFWTVSYLKLPLFFFKWLMANSNGKHGESSDPEVWPYWNTKCVPNSSFPLPRQAELNVRAVVPCSDEVDQHSW